MAGRMSASARAAVLLAVPLSPRISTPPMLGSTAHNSSAVCSLGWPTTAANGKLVLLICFSLYVARRLAARLQQGFAVQVQGAQLLQRFGTRRFPHAATRRFEQAFGDGVLRPRIGLLQKLLHLRIEA